MDPDDMPPLNMMVFLHATSQLKYAIVANVVPI